MNIDISEYSILYRSVRYILYIIYYILYVIYYILYIVELVTGLSQNYSTRPPDLEGLDHKVDEIGIPVQW